MKTIIIDDEQTSIDALTQKLQSYDDITIAGTAQSGLKGIVLVRNAQPDLLFIDVEMPDMSGLEFLNQIGNIIQKPCKVVIYTAHSNYILPAFRGKAFDFLLKPDYTKPMKPHFVMDPNVVVFTLFPGIQENIVRHILDAPELRSIVMRTYGSGNAPQKPWLMHLLKQATEHGINIVNISQCAAGTVEMARYDNGYQLKNAGVISGYDATVESTVTKLMHLQGHYTDWRIIRNLMNHPMRGEFTQNL